MNSNTSFITFRKFSTGFKYVYNRNPRNLEKLTIGYRPSGWHLENPGREHWHKLTLEVHGRNITASVKHFTGAIPIIASTKEWTIRKHLYSSIDKAAFRNLGRVLGRRCLETGIIEMRCDLVPIKGGRVEAFLNELETSGIQLKESSRYINPQPSDADRPVKLWEL